MPMRCSLSLNLGFFSDLRATRRLAEDHGLGLEIQHFADGQTLDNDWRERAAEIATALSGFAAPLSLHGPFDSLNPASWDPQIGAASRARYLHALQIADRLGARTIVFHAWYNPSMRFHGGVEKWAARQIPAWGDLARAAERYGLTLVLENTWEPDAAAQLAVIRGVNSPHLQACLDTGHANMTGAQSFAAWVEQLGAHLVYVHAHNNSGSADDHWPFGQGTLDMRAALALLDAAPARPNITLELKNTPDQLATLGWLTREGLLPGARPR